MHIFIFQYQEQISVYQDDILIQGKCKNIQKYWLEIFWVLHPDRMANIQMSARERTEDKTLAAIPNDLHLMEDDKIPHIIGASLSGQFSHID